MEETGIERNTRETIKQIKREPTVLL